MRKEGKLRTKDGLNQVVCKGEEGKLPVDQGGTANHTEEAELSELGEHVLDVEEEEEEGGNGEKAGSGQIEG